MSSSHSHPVSVVIATRDRLALLQQALDSIWNQDYAGAIRVVCVFDGPIPAEHGLAAPGATADGAARTLRVVGNRRASGLAGARNYGLSQVETDLVALCDDDDTWHPEKLRLQVAAAIEDVVCVGGGIRVCTPDSAVDRPAPAAEITFDDLLLDRVMELHPSTLLLRADAVRAIGGWDETLPGGYAEDYDLLLRLARAGRIVLVDAIVSDILWSGQSYYFSRWSMIADALRHLLEKFPEFERQPRGRARINGQIAFALSASGRYDEAGPHLRSARRDNWREPRAALARIVHGHPKRAHVIQQRLHAHGRGI